jgi:hypothetical protein
VQVVIERLLDFAGLLRDIDLVADKMGGVVFDSLGK